MFNERKVSQVAAFLLLRAGDQPMSRMKIIKLLYIADRNAVRELGFSLSQDNHVSMDHGPVLSQTLRLIQQAVPSQPGEWHSWIRNDGSQDLALNRSVVEEDLDELSLAECELLENVWQSYGHMTASQLRNWTHQNCSEWERPEGTSIPITSLAIAKAVGLSEVEAGVLAEQAIAQDSLDRALATR
jgi:uncharacterized phage-associated protein